jgi:2OG-Fe(II) oxygenase superfamily
MIISKWQKMLLVTMVGAASRASLAWAAASGRDSGRKFRLTNDSVSRMNVAWVHPTTKEAVSMTEEPIVPGADFVLDSFVGHEFEISEVPGGKTGVCNRAPDKKCRVTYTTVSANDNQVVHLLEDWTVEFVDNQVAARREAANLLKGCQEAARERLEAAGSDKKEAEAAMTALLTCVETGVATELERVHEEISFQATVRKDIAALLENYTCSDSELESTPDVRADTWTPPSWVVNNETGQVETNSPLNVHIKLDRPASRIHVIENFIRQDECDAMEQQAAPSLHRATVADGKGGHRVSEARKAMQAGITVPWDEESADHPIARVSRRVYDYVNHVLGLDIKEHGQEDLMSIQYFGKGLNSTEPRDRYMPHCDGDCTGAPHKFGQRMATVVMYCITADVGGHTNFRNAGVHVKPEKYSAVFFSYVDPVTLTMDTGFTEHSGCPVLEVSTFVQSSLLSKGLLISSMLSCLDIG